MNEKDFEVKSKEALAWVAGFFTGEGSVSISYRANGFTGIVGLAQKNREPLDLVRKIIMVNNVKVLELHFSERMQFFQLDFNSVRGSEFLQLIMPFPLHPKHRKRAELYLKMFPPGEKYVHRKTERQDIYIEWLQLRITEVT